MNTPSLPDLKIKSGRYEFNFAWTFAQLKNSYWGGHYTAESLWSASDYSTCVSAFIGDRQIGFLRVVTDTQIVSLMTDVIVDENWRRKGVATAMISEALKHDSIRRTICVIQARPVNFPLYQKFGFVPVGTMFKRDPQ